ncbi:MAG: GSU2204 family CXXCH-containing (seleno)protein, partial [Desulfuromonas sp.]|nr:GSU2204 family CXXCH-containing (seleno)protein [Desulfuromonas sp.]
MKQSQLWLLALLSVLALMVTTSVAVAGADNARISGFWEMGMSGITTDKNAARVNEYGSVRNDDGIALAPKLNLDLQVDKFLLEVESETKGPRDQMHELRIDAGRIFRLDSELNILEHRKDHETLSQMGATGRNDIGGSQPSVTTDKIYADLIKATGDPNVSIGGAQMNTYDPAAAWDQEVSNNYIVTRREWKNEAELVIPQLSNITFKAGSRIETREGMEQAIGLSKCDGCHVSAAGKKIDERTEEFTFGATGKFGILTADYEYMNRSFNEDANAPTRFYDVMQNGSAAHQMLYGGDNFEFGRTPDSEKESHMLKARVDLPRDTSISASYVKSDIESSKSSTQGDYFLQGSNKLKSEYESFAAKLATKLGKSATFSLRGKYYEIDADSNSIYYPAREAANTVKFINNLGVTDSYSSSAAREVSEFGADMMFRLAKSTTLRLGYEYEEIDRDDKELGRTETHTLKGALKTRINKTLSARVSYKYQSIDDPLPGAHVGIAQLRGTPDGFGSGLMTLPTIQDTSGNTLYWNDVYPARDLSSTSLPEDVHEAKFSSTWAPSANMAATIYARLRYEENDSVKYEQTTIVPGATFWYAPTSKLNLTMAYNFSKQD